MVSLFLCICAGHAAGCARGMGGCGGGELFVTLEVPLSALPGGRRQDWIRLPLLARLWEGMWCRTMGQWPRGR